MDWKQEVQDLNKILPLSNTAFHWKIRADEQLYYEQCKQ